MALLINKFNRQYFEVVVVTFKKTDAAYDFSADKSYELKTNRVLFSVLAISRVIKKEKPDYLFSTLTYVNTYIGLCDYVFKFRTILVACESTIPPTNNRRNGLGL
ncbi:hypothetical protein, partial [Enterococcus faecium]|uniref:hypothetical protein n=1 Tax=Enterococcus faecium TaxID=1352 RepID=UPI003AAC1F3A